MRQGLVQAGLILSLVELAKSPVEEIAGLARADREVARAYIEQMQRVVAAIGDAATDLRARLDHHQTEWRGDALKAGDGDGSASEAAADHAQRKGCLPHRHLSPDSPSRQQHSYTGFAAAMKPRRLTACGRKSRGSHRGMSASMKQARARLGAEAITRDRQKLAKRCCPRRKVRPPSRLAVQKDGRWPRASAARERPLSDSRGRSRSDSARRS